MTHRSIAGIPTVLLTSLLVASPLNAAYEDKVEKTFSTTGAGTLTLDFNRGAIDIDTHDGSKVKVSIARVMKNGNRSDFEEETQRVETSFKQNGNDIRVDLKYERPKHGLLGFFSGGRKQIHFKSKVLLPRVFNVDASTAGDRITLKNLSGEASLKTSGGGIRIENVTGNAHARTSGGSIEVSQCQGTLDLRTSGGKIHADQAVGSLSARTSGGGIYADGIAGDADVATSGGPIKLGTVQGNVMASTSGGGIEVTLSGQPTKDCILKTSGGSIDIAVSPDTHLRIDASTSGGGVHSNLTLSGLELKGSSLQGQLNEGGPLLKARTSGGSIHIRALGKG